MTAEITLSDNGDLVSRGGDNGGWVRLHLSRFHGLIVTASRTYIGQERPTEATAYFGNPQAVADWLAECGYSGSAQNGTFL